MSGAGSDSATPTSPDDPRPLACALSGANRTAGKCFSLKEPYLRAGCSRWWAVASLRCSRPFRQASQARSLAESGSSTFCRAVVRPWASHQRSNSLVVYSRSWVELWVMAVPPDCAARRCPFSCWATALAPPTSHYTPRLDAGRAGVQERGKDRRSGNTPQEGMTVAREEEKLRLGKGAAFVKGRLKRLRQEDETWEADFQALPKPITQSRTDYLGMAVAPDGSLLADAHVQGRPTVKDMATLLSHVMRRPLTGKAPRPRRLHRAAAVGEQVRQEDGVRAACDALEGLLQVARPAAATREMHRGLPDWRRMV